jgi:hypothetical protein
VRPVTLATSTSVSYQDGGEDAIWAHMLRAIDSTTGHLGPHALPCSGFSDWDDTLNVDHGSGLAESVCCGMQFCRALLDFAELADHIGDSEQAERMRELYRAQAAALDAYAWDGAWYARCFDDEGKPIGVAAEPVHRINLNPQTWSVLSEAVPRERAARAMPPRTRCSTRSTGWRCSGRRGRDSLRCAGSGSSGTTSWCTASDQATRCRFGSAVSRAWATWCRCPPRAPVRSRSKSPWARPLWDVTAHGASAPDATAP